MSRLQAIPTEAAGTKARPLLEAVQAKLKMTPNFMRVMANAPAVLEGYLGLSGALAGGVLTAKFREEIALVVAEQNGCHYCLSAHTAIGKMTGLTDAEIEAARDARSESPRKAAAFTFARRIMEKRGHVTSQEFEAVRNAGFSDAEIAEIVTHVALNIFTNYFNTATDVEIDFPKVALKTVA